MRKLVITLVASGLIWSGAGNVMAEDPHAGHNHDAPAAMPEMGPPAQMKEVAFLVGEWDVAGRMRMAPDAEWIDNTATCSFEYIAGGAALMMKYNSTMMGMEMTGVGITTYDRENKVWQETWVDNFSGRHAMYTGNVVDGKRVVEGDDIMGGQRFKSRMTTFDMTDTSYKWTMEHSMDKGKTWFVSMESTSTKK